MVTGFPVWLCLRLLSSPLSRLSGFQTTGELLQIYRGIGVPNGAEDYVLPSRGPPCLRDWYVPGGSWATDGIKSICKQYTVLPRERECSKAKKLLILIIWPKCLAVASMFSLPSQDPIVWDYSS